MGSTLPLSRGPSIVPDAAKTAARVSPRELGLTQYDGDNSIAIVNANSSRGWKGWASLTPAVNALSVDSSTSFPFAFAKLAWHPTRMPLPRTWTLFGKEHLPHRLLLLAKMIDRETGKQLQTEFGISLAEWRVLAFVCASGPTTATNIGNAAEVDRAEVSRAVRRLSEAELVLRNPDESHGKRFIIRATPSGERLFDKIRNRRKEYFQSVMSGLSREDCETLDLLIEAIATKVCADRNV